MQTVGQWLEHLGLGQYTEAFERNAVDLEIARDLTDQDLERLGVVALGHRKKLLKAIAELNGIHAQAPTPLAQKDQASPEPSLGTEAERRQLTVMFCDMVGFTELASRLDPEILRGVIRRYEDTCAAAITRYEGYVFQRLGDGIVAFFGYPLAHEGEAERAIRAGLEIIDALSELDVANAGHLQVRIGIATGLVVVSAAEKSAAGETMNLAARLQAIAERGSIVVSERVQRLCGGAFDYQDLGEQTLKGIAHPTHAYRILGVGQATSRFDAAHQGVLTPMVGREQEIGLLLERWQLAQEGEGQVVLLSGEPGLGKSRILSALRGRLENIAATLRFQCSPYYVNSAFYPSIDNFERALKFERGEPASSKLDKLEALVVRHFGRPVSDVRFIASILSIPCEERYGPLSITPQKQKDETLRVLVDLTEAAARRQPSLMLYEDAHWADPTSLEVLDLLVDRIRGFPMLLVVTHRPEFQPKWSSHGHVAALALSRLTRSQSAAMVFGVSGGKPLPSELVEQIVAKTDGVPLFVEELTKAVLESGTLKDAGQKYEYVGSPGSVPVPATLRDSLMARLDRFLPVKETAQIGAAIGREFSYELIAAVSPLDESRLDEALRQLTESGLAFRRGTAPDALYTFKHALVQDAAYDSLLKSRRQELHSKIARVIDERFPTTKDTEPELLAHHLTAAGLAEAAIPFWKRAGELALNRMAVNEAIAHLNKGLELSNDQPESPERDTNELALQTLLGTTWMAFKGFGAAEVWASYQAALPLAKRLGRNETLLPILDGLRVNVLVRGRVAESLDWVKELFEAAERSGDPSLLVTAHRGAMISYFYLGDLLTAREHGDKVLALYDEKAHRHIVRLTNRDPKMHVGVFASHWTWMLGCPDQAVRINDEMEASARRRNHPFELCYALSTGAEVFDLRCEPENYRQRFEEAIRLGREHNLSMFSKLQAPVRRGIALVREGKVAEGIGLLEPGLAEWRGSGFHLEAPYWASALAEGLALIGDTAKALRQIDESLDQMARPGWEERDYCAEILRVKGWILSLKGDLEGAERNYLASLDWARKQQAKSWELRTSTSLARLWSSQGKRKDARDLLAPIYNWFTEGFDTKDLKDAKALLTELEA